MSSTTLGICNPQLEAPLNISREFKESLSEPNLGSKAIEQSNTYDIITTLIKRLDDDAKHTRTNDAYKLCLKFTINYLNELKKFYWET